MEHYIKYTPLVLLCLYISKILVLNPSFMDAPIVLALAAYAYLHENRLDNKRLLGLEEKLNSQHIEFKEKFKEMEDVRSYVGSLKASLQHRKIG